MQRRGKDVIDVIDVKSGKRAYALDDFPFEQMIGPTFSPDGRRIAFVGATGEQSDIWVADVDGTNLRQLTSDIYGDHQPSWSPDGKWIAFASERGEQTDVETLRFGKWRISLLEVATGRVEVLLGSPGIVFSREALLSRVWDEATFVTVRSVDTLVKRVRKKIESDPAEPAVILTVWGAGYKAADVA